MTSEQLKKFSAVDFNPEKYVKEVSQVCVGGQELQSHRSKIQSLAEETNQLLKKNVYKNYMQFIETAREISHLESEMYQLSHLLSEQRALLSSMGDSGAGPVLDPNGILFPQVDEKRIASLKTVSQSVANCPNLLDTTDRQLLYEGDLLELDPLENTTLGRSRAFLFSDSLLIATSVQDKKSPIKYKFECSYDLGSLAVVNVRDLGQVKHAFKLLVFPDTRLFQCANNEIRVEWLRNFDEAKKALLKSDAPKKKTTPQSPQIEPIKSPIRTDSLDYGSNPFGYSTEEGEVETVPEWLSEAADDLDVLIAQRHFEEAFSLILRSEEYLRLNEGTSPSLPEIKCKVIERRESLTNTLLSELTVGAEKSLQGGLRASRRGVMLLNKLGKSTQACELYLKVCANLLKAQSKRVKREGATVAYVKRLSQVYFSNLASITSEFQYRTFPNNRQCTSAFVVWVSMEVSNFMSHFIKQVFIPQTQLGTLAECVDIVRKQSQQMCDLGLDLSYQVNGQVMSSVTRSIADAAEKAADAVKVRAGDDPWRPSRQTSQSVSKLQSDLGLPLSQYLTDDGWFELTTNSISFCKLFSSLSVEGLLISSPDGEHALGRALADVLEAHLKHIASSLNRLPAQRALIQRNAKFLLEVLLGSVQRRFVDKMGHPSKRLQTLAEDYGFTTKETTKTTVTGYI